MAKITNKGMLREREYKYRLDLNDEEQINKRKRWKVLSYSNTKLDKPMVCPDTGDRYIGIGLRLMSGHVWLDGQRKVTCPKSSEGCRSVCLATSGHGGFNDGVHEAEYQRTYAFYKDRDFFFSKLYKELCLFIKKVDKMGAQVAFRSNTNSDLAINRAFSKWMERKNLDLVKPIKKYDYTKVLAYTKKNKDVHYTFSAAEDNRADVMEAMALGLNIAVVVRDKSYDNNYGYNIVDGDITDARFLDPANSIVLLQGKGEAKSSDSDFIFNNLKDFITWLQR